VANDPWTRGPLRSTTPPAQARKDPLGQDPTGSHDSTPSGLHLVSTFREWGQLLLVVSSNPSDLLFCSPNGIRTRVFTLRGRFGPPPESAAIRRSPGQGLVVPAGVRPNRWVPRGFSSNASSTPEAPGGRQNAGFGTGFGHGQTHDVPLPQQPVQPRPPGGRPFPRRRSGQTRTIDDVRPRTTSDTWCRAGLYQVRSGS